MLVCLGSTANQALFGPRFRVTRERGKVLEFELAPRVIATVHPSSLLRQPDEESREREYKLFVQDLRVALKASSQLPPCCRTNDCNELLVKKGFLFTRIGRLVFLI